MSEEDDFEGLARTLPSLAENFAQASGFFLGDGAREAQRAHQEVAETPTRAGPVLGRMYRDLIDRGQAMASCWLRAKQSFDCVVGNSGGRDYDEAIRKIKRNSDAAKPKADLFSNDLADTVRKISATRAGEFVHKKFSGEPKRAEKDGLQECVYCGGLREKKFCGSRVDPNEEVVGVGEAAVAHNLRTLCTPYGEEKAEKLEETSIALLKLGKVYLHKSACETRGILQKLSFVRCFALLHAARIRLEGLNLPMSGSRRDVDDALIAANAKLLKAINKCHADPSKLKMEPRYSTLSFSVDRIAVNDILGASNADFQPLPTATPEELEEGRAERIEKMKRLNNFMTEKYIDTMQNIAMKCFSYLGAPPITFTIVGLGSLARREITLFSDFEHIILLEEGCHSVEILEYFRWFTVLFQVIVIGIGETIVPSLCVRSINNLYSNKKGDDCWFHDIFTHCGVAFDGMAPFSCATPLGRQIVDKHCSVRMELIKTVGEMLAYMVPESNSGYQRNLKQMLSSSCFVFGDEQLYRNFREGVQKIIRSQNRQDLAEESTSVITQNRIPQIRNGYYAVRGLARLNQKTSYYRPFTLLVACLGRIHDVDTFETFEILDALKRKEVINSALHHKLTFAFAVICEMRIRSYCLSKTQRRIIFLDDVRTLVGEEAEWNCKDMMQWLQDSVTKYPNETFRDFSQDYDAYRPKIEVRKWYFSGQYEKAVELGKQYLPLCQNLAEDEASTFMYWFFKSCYQAGQPTEKRFYWDELEPLYQSLTQSPFTLQREKAECYCIMAEVYEARKQIQKAHEVTKKWLQFYLERASNGKNQQLHEPSEKYEAYLRAAHAELRPGGEEMPEFLNNLLSDGLTDSASTLRYLRYMIQAAARESEDVGDASWLADLADDIKDGAREINEPRKLLKVIWAFQINNRCWADALRTVDYIKEFPDIPCTDADHRASEGKDWSVLYISCAVAELVHALAKGRETMSKYDKKGDNVEESGATAAENLGGSD